jgi:hypothetical protein
MGFPRRICAAHSKMKDCHASMAAKDCGHSIAALNAA